MNKQRRKEIERIINGLISWQDAIEEVLSEEQDYLDNMPENLQSSEKAEIAENAISNLEEALDNIRECIDNLESILEG
jgi:5,10-methenyltetrahydromethanopterin hydrogenase